MEYKKELAKNLLKQSNFRMTQLAMMYLRNGKAQDAHAAAKMACDEHGPSLAYELQQQLRGLGAEDVKVTCP